MKPGEIISPGQHAWNASSIIVYAILLVLVGYGIRETGQDIEKLRIRDVVMLMLATYRLTRMVVFEKIFKYFRDLIKSKPSNKLMNTFTAIVTCPWCAGVWMALILVALFFLVPYGGLLVLLLAISGVATFIVLMSNWIAIKIDKEQS